MVGNRGAGGARRSTGCCTLEVQHPVDRRAPPAPRLPTMLRRGDAPPDNRALSGGRRSAPHTPYSLRHAGNAATTEMPVPRHTLEPGQVASFRGLPARDRTPECLEESKLSEGRCRLSGREGRVQRERVTELHFIAPLDNLRSIMTHGVLSHRLAQSVRHTSIALPEVQERRNAKRVPNGLPIHDYVNLYFDARNPMMYSRLNRLGELVIVRVDPAVMSQPGAIITDGNAASESTLFLPSPAGLVQLDESLVYAHSWNCLLYTSPSPRD